jgi:hypothetical protein
MWVFTVALLTKRRCAISVFDRPAASRASGEPAAPDEQHRQAGEHVGQGHHHQRRGPCVRAGDVVREAEPADRRAGPVGGGEHERHPGAHPGDPQTGGQPARVSQYLAGTVEAQVREVAREGTHDRPGPYADQLEHDVVAAAGDRVQEEDGGRTRHRGLVAAGRHATLTQRAGVSRRPVVLPRSGFQGL